MLDIMRDAFFDTAKMIPFLYIIYVVSEFWGQFTRFVIETS